MGSPCVDDIVWICDICKGYIDKKDLFRPDPNKYDAFHEECAISEVYYNWSEK